eukprot:15189640-Alexandrium_andersonii.AAC.1
MAPSALPPREATLPWANHGTLFCLPSARFRRPEQQWTAARPLNRDGRRCSAGSPLAHDGAANA